MECAEYLKFSNVKIHSLIALCFSLYLSHGYQPTALCLSLCLSHGYLPAALIETTIVPVVKNKSGNKSDSNNNRPNALVTIVSKILCFADKMRRISNFM